MQYALGNVTESVVVILMKTKDNIGPLTMLSWCEACDKPIKQRRPCLKLPTEHLTNCEPKSCQFSEWLQMLLLTSEHWQRFRGKRFPEEGHFNNNYSVSDSTGDIYIIYCFHLFYKTIWMSALLFKMCSNRWEWLLMFTGSWVSGLQMCRTRVIMSSMWNWL